MEGPQMVDAVISRRNQTNRRRTSKRQWICQEGGNFERLQVYLYRVIIFAHESIVKFGNEHLDRRIIE